MSARTAAALGYGVHQSCWRSRGQAVTTNMWLPAVACLVASRIVRPAVEGWHAARRSCIGIDDFAVLLQVDQQHVIIDYKGGKVTCSDAGLRLRVEKAMQRLTEAMNPINLDHNG